MSVPVTGNESTQRPAHPGTAGETPAPPGTVPLPGQRLADKYVVERVIGVGGMAVVLAARHVHLDQRVAIKLLLPQYACDGATVARFLREGQAASRIRSEHVVRVFDVGILAGEGPYLVLELLEGRDLDTVVAAGRLPIAVAVDYVLQACEAVAEAHALGIVHRDLKPANLFLSRTADGMESIKVLDFGISKVAPTGGGLPEEAKLTRTGALMGTPVYMAPEQMRGLRDVDARTDIWGVGSILYELCAGKAPFTGESMTQLAAAVMTDPVPLLRFLRTDVPVELDSIIGRCLQKRPEDRYASLAELAHALVPLGSPAARVSLERIVRVLGPRLDTTSPSYEGSVRLASATTLSGTEKRPRARLWWAGAAAAMLGLGVLGAAAFVRVGYDGGSGQAGAHLQAAASASVDPPAPSAVTVAPPAVSQPPPAQPEAAAQLSATVAPLPPLPVKAARPVPAGKKPFIATDREK